jgi:hypothetical protein
VHEFPFQSWGRLACIVAVWGPLMACQPTAPAAPPSGVPATTAQATGTQKNDKSAQKHLWRTNPSPKQVFEVEFEIHGAPGPLADFEGSASYHAPNCWFVTSEWAGARAVPQTGLAMPTKRLGPNRFLAAVYRDGMVDEDYYGTGACQWALMSASFGFRATGGKDETSYVVDLDNKEIRDGTSFSRYYWKGSYPRMKNESGVPISAVGVSKPDDLLPGFRENVFYITAKVSAKP